VVKGGRFSWLLLAHCECLLTYLVIVSAVKGLTEWRLATVPRTDTKKDWRYFYVTAGAGPCAEIVQYKLR